MLRIGGSVSAGRGFFRMGMRSFATSKKKEETVREVKLNAGFEAWKTDKVDGFYSSLSPHAVKIIGFDINTHNTGFCVIDAKKGTIDQLGCIELDKEKSTFERVEYANEAFEKIKQEHSDPETKWIIAVESALINFVGKTFRQQDICALIKINGLISYKAFNSFVYKKEAGSISEQEKWMTSTHPNSIRSYFDLKKPSSTDMEMMIQTALAGDHVHPKRHAAGIKPVVWRFCHDTMTPNVPWITTKTGTFKEVNYDCCDALLTGVYAFHSFREDRLFENVETRDQAIVMCSSKPSKGEMGLTIEKLRKDFRDALKCPVLLDGSEVRSIVLHTQQ